MANNIAVSVTADTAGLVSGMAVAKAAVQDYGKEMRALARTVRDGDTSQETRAKLLEVSEAFAKAEATVASYSRQLKGTQAASKAANDNSGQLRAGFQNLGYQLQDISVQFAGGQRAATIFAQQLPQVAGALTQIAQAGGNTTGALGRLATFMQGPWGIAVGIAAAVLPTLIGKLFETGDAADTAKEKVWGFAEALADLRSKPMETLGRLEGNLRMAEGATRAARSVPIQSGSGEAGRVAAESANARRQRAIDDAELAERNARSELEVARRTAKTNETLFSIGARAGRAKALSRDDDDGSGSRSRKGRSSGSSEANAAKREAEERARAEIAAKLAANEQIFALDEDRYRTEASLSQIALRAKLSDIDAEQRAGTITAAQAIEAKANVDDQIEALDEKLQARLFLGKIKQLEADRSNYAAGTAEYERYTRQIELLQQQHLNRQLVLDQTAQTRARTAEKQAQAAEAEDLKRAEEQNRAIQERTVAPFAQSLARMLTLQRGFIGTVRDLWGSMVGIVEQAVTRMLTVWLISLAAQNAASEKQHAKLIIMHAKDAAAGAYKAVVGIPIVGPVLAPIAAAAAFAGVMAFSAEDGWDVPGGAGAGIDGRGGRPAIIHPREMVLPANIADAVRAMPDGIAATASLRGAAASVAGISNGAFSSPRINGGTAGRENAAQRQVSMGNLNVTIHAFDAPSVKRMFMDHKGLMAEALRKHVRDGGR